MSHKKKKPKATGAQRAAGVSTLTDIFSDLDEVQNCLDRAPTQESACVEGIRKADSALKQCQGDVGLMCPILIKRAQLLFIAAEKCFHISSQHFSPLDSCIADCEEVLRLSEIDPHSKELYSEAKELLDKAKKYSGKDAMIEVKSGRRPQHTHQPPSDTKRFTPRYDPEKTMFKEVSKINKYLLQDIVNCYRRAVTVCRVCFYKNRRQEQVGKNRFCKMCNKVVTGLIVIPASMMCQNFANLKVIPIPSPPRMLTSGSYRKKPFTYCQSQDHVACFSNAATNEVWFAHSIEELVIWTIERHFRCNFKEYIERHHQDVSVPYNPSSGSVDIEPRGRQAQHSQLDTFEEDDQDAVLYDPKLFTVSRSKSVPKPLLQSILECFEHNKEYCKWCFYKSYKKSAVSLNSRGSMCCSLCKKPWESVVVIPRSKLCDNFGNFDFLPIAPWPRSKPTKDPFEYCLKQDHYRCFRIYIHSEFWYSHSVEEMVIWTFEREKGCSFNEFFQKLKGSLSSLPPRVGPQPSSAAPVNSSPALARVVPPAESRPAPIAQRVFPQVFKLSEVNFSSVAEIPLHLLQTIAQCFAQKLEVCRKCFYGERCLSSQLQEDGTCTLGVHQWHNPIDVIPGCNLCDNEPCFQQGDYIALPPLPPVAVIKKCSSTNHHKCFSKAMEYDARSAHSVEELVVWLIESETESGFIEYVTELVKFKQESASQPKALPSPSYLVVNSAVQSPPSSDQPVPSTSGNKKQHKYEAKGTVFTTIADIPADLMTAVAACFHKRRVVCRECFFESDCKSLTPKNSSTNICEKNHIWRKVKVIPRCMLCSGPDAWIPILQLPKHMVASKSPFLICNKSDHSKCYTMSKQNDPWFPHTVEELVIWTVEREKECKFENVYEAYLKSAAKPTASSMVISMESNQSSQRITQYEQRPDIVQGAMQPTLASVEASHASGTGSGNGILLKDLAAQQSHFYSEDGPAEDPYYGAAASQQVPLLENNLASFEQQHEAALFLTQVDETAVPTFSDALQIFPSLRPTAAPETSGSRTEQISSVKVPNTVPLPIGAQEANVYFTPLQPVPVVEPQPFLTVNSSQTTHQDRPSLDGADFNGSGTPFTATFPVPSLPAPGSASTELLLSMADADSELLNKFEQIKAQSELPALFTEGQGEPPGLQDEQNWPELSNPPLPAATGLSFVKSGLDISFQTEEPHLSHNVYHPLTAHSQPLGVGDSSDFQGMSNSTLQFTDVDQLHNNISQSSDFQMLSLGPNSQLHGSGSQHVATSESQTWSSVGVEESSNQVEVALSDSAETHRVTVVDKMMPQAASDVSPSLYESANDREHSHPDSPNNNTTGLTIPEAHRSEEYTSDSGLNGNVVLETEHNVQFVEAQPTAASIGDYGRKQYQVGQPPKRNDNVTPEVTISFSDVQVGTSVHNCRLCYAMFETQAQLLQHCRSSQHSKVVAADCGGHHMWKYLPPPPDLTPREFTVCARPDECSQDLLCKCAHSADQLTEWIERYEHRNKRAVQDYSAPDFSLQFLSKELLDHKTIVTTISGPLRRTLSDDDEDCFSVTITLEGENWQCLFGVHCSDTVFTITRVEGDLDAAVYPESSTWKASSPVEAMLLGKVAVTVEANPPRQSGEYHCKLSFNLGFKEYLYIWLCVEVPDVSPVDQFPDPQLEESDFSDPELDIRMVAEDAEPLPRSHHTEQQPLPEVEPALHSGSLSNLDEPVPTYVPDEAPYKIEPLLSEAENRNEVFHKELKFEEEKKGEEEEEEEEQFNPSVEDTTTGWQLSSESSEGELRIEPEDYTLLHVPIEDQVYSLTDEDGAVLSSVDLD